MAATALVIQECQNGVIGPDSLLPRLAEAAAPAVPFIARLAHGARAASVPVIHALALLEHAVENPAAHVLAHLLTAADTGEVLAGSRQHRISRHAHGRLQAGVGEVDGVHVPSDI